MNAKDGDTVSGTSYFFAGGGTGGHIYPAIAIAEKIRQNEPDANILFFCSNRKIDSQILSGAGFEFVPLPGSGFSIRPDKAMSFVASIFKGYDIAKKTIASALRDNMTGRGVMIGVGGFASVPAVLAAGRTGLPIAVVNVDIVPGRANKLLAGFAKKIFVQFDDTADHFGKAHKRVVVTGCPLRESFTNPDGTDVADQIGIDPNKKTVVVTGASSGSLNINRAVTKLLGALDEFEDQWQLVHLTGSAANTRQQLAACGDVKLPYLPIDYCDDMAGLYACADLIVGRSGAVSIAEFAASATPAICLPYPYHKDRHQYLNAGKLVDAGAAVVVDDIPDDNDATAKSLQHIMKELMADDERRNSMAQAAAQFASISASAKIADALTVI